MPTEWSADVVLRPAVPDDADAVADAHLTSRAAASMPPPVHSDDEVRGWLAGRLHVDDVWVAEVGGRVVGYARLTPAWLDDLYVVPGHARHGVGSALLDVAKTHRPAGFCLWVFEENTAARAFYARHGLVELERTDGDDNEEHAPDIRVAWPGAYPLAFYRSLIDDVDRHLGDVLARRAALTRAVQPHKKRSGRDPARELRIAETMATRAPALGTARLARIVDAVITESLDAAHDVSST